MKEKEQLLEELLIKYDFAKELLETQLSILIKNFELNNNYNPVEHVKSRLKTEKSIIKKLEKKGYEYSIENIKEHIHDIIGIRIVCSFISDVYDIVRMLKESNQFNIKKEKDYIESPKDSGYISYHLIIEVPVCLNGVIQYFDAEIQIRTLAMDFWASIDHKIHYKFENAPIELKDELLDCSINIKKLDNKMNELNEMVNNLEEN